MQCYDIKMLFIVPTWLCLDIIDSVLPCYRYAADLLCQNGDGDVD